MVIISRNSMRSILIISCLTSLLQWQSIAFIVNTQRLQEGCHHSTQFQKHQKVTLPHFGIDIRSQPLFSTPTKQDKENGLVPDDDADTELSKVLVTDLLSQKKDYESLHPDMDSIANLIPLEEEFENLALSTKSQIRTDPSLKLVSSELSLQNFISTYAPHRIAPSKDGIPFALLLERTADTVEDVAVHLRRIPYEKGNKRLTEEEEATRKTVVILGSGWAAHALMKVADCNKLRLIVVSPSNHFLFTPMLAGAAVGTVEYSSMTEAVRAANPMIDQYIEGKATSVSLQNQTVTIKLSTLSREKEQENNKKNLETTTTTDTDPTKTITLPYDHLVVSVGCRVDDKGVPGARKHALRLKTCDDARRLRTAIGECFEYASRPDVANNPTKQRERVTFLIAGGGPTGVELAGEIYDLAKDITREYGGVYPKLKERVRVVLAHGGKDLVPQFDQGLREEAKKSLERKGVEVLLNTRVSEVGDGFAKLSTKVFDETTGEAIGWKEQTMNLGVTVWCAGTAPVSFVEQILSQLPPECRNNDGKIRVDQWLRPTAMPPGIDRGSILVAGDAAAFPENDKDYEGALLPQTAQVAGQQGAYAARLLDRGYDLSLTPPVLRACFTSVDGAEEDDDDDGAICDVFIDPAVTEWLKVRGLIVAPGFQFLNLGMLAYLGGGEALSQVQLGDAPLFSQWGSVGFLLWRSVYLVKQVATRNRVLVTFDWIKSAIFGRDMTRP